MNNEFVSKEERDYSFKVGKSLASALAEHPQQALVVGRGLVDEQVLTIGRLRREHLRPEGFVAGSIFTSVIWFFALYITKLYQG